MLNVNCSEMVEAGRKFLAEIDNVLTVDVKINENEWSINFNVTYTVGAPWTLELEHPNYEVISLDFGKTNLNVILCFISF